MQKQGVQVKSSVKDSRWYDVGIVKVTNMVVTHYYVPYEDNMADVRTFKKMPEKHLSSSLVCDQFHKEINIQINRSTDSSAMNSG